MELPQEIVDEVRHYANMRNTDKQDFGGLLHKICLDDTSKGAQIASEYYEPKLAEKDAKIKEQEKAIDILERTVTQSHNETTAAIDQINKLTLLLRGRLFLGDSCAGNEDYNNSIWQDYCKQHGIEP